MRARLYLDEDVLPELARVLRAAGHEVVSAHEVAALGVSDEEQLGRAAAEGRALLTFNYRDFLKLAREWFGAGRSHAGVVSYGQYRHRELGELRDAVIALLETLTAEDLRDTVWVLDAFRQPVP